MSDTCGKNCRGYPRRAYCSDRTCGAGDCKTCMGEGVCHDTCDVAVTCKACEGYGDIVCPDCDGSGMAGDDTCDRCLGYEVLTCPDCDGTGEA